MTIILPPCVLQVQGVGVPNPFRLRSLLGARIPLNATYSPLISFYNPFDTALQVITPLILHNNPFDTALQVIFNPFDTAR